MTRLANTHPVVDGWSQPTFTMGVDGTDYWRRAIIAKVGLGVNLVEDAIMFHDADGNDTDRVDHSRIEAVSDEVGARSPCLRILL